METQVVTVSVFFKNKILEVRTIFEAISKQNKCKFLWLPNKKLIFRGLFISKFSFSTHPFRKSSFVKVKLNFSHIFSFRVSKQKLCVQHCSENTKSRFKFVEEFKELLSWEIQKLSATPVTAKSTGFGHSC